MSVPLRCLLVAGLLGACSRQADKPAPPATGLTTATAASVSPAAAKGRKPASVGAKASGKPSGAASAPPTRDAGAAEAPKIIEDDNLKTEEREANPFSETVTLKLSVTPQAKAAVHWGAKVLARLEPGKMDAEITQPRGSGPLDIEIKAEGYMPYHTRFYTDRNDRLGVRLYRPEEAPNLLGYKRSPEGKQAEAEKTAKGEKPEKSK
jgi:hypothetical protein